MAQLRKKITATHGPSPWWMKWAYTCVALPTLLYGAHVWAHKATDKELLSLQRFALITIAPVLGNAPTAGLQAILDIMPLKLVIRQHALMKYLAIRDSYERIWNGTNKAGLKVGFVNHLKQEEIALYGQPVEWDSINSTNNRLTFQQELLDDPDITVYTDGSKMDGKVGYGLTIQGDLNINTFGALIPEGTVFRAELQGLLVTANILIQNKVRGKKIQVRCDSSSALKALSSPNITSSLVRETKDKWNHIGAYNTASLAWIKAHVGHEGNELADQLAKQGTTQIVNPINAAKPSRTHVKNTIRDTLFQMWATEWEESTIYLSTKIWFPFLDPKKAPEFIKLTRAQLGMIIAFITGFNNLNRHSKKKNAAIDNMCRICQNGEEKAIHLITDCEPLLAFSKKTMERFHEEGTWEVAHLNTFLNHPLVRQVMVTRTVER